MSEKLKEALDRLARLRGLKTVDEVRAKTLPWWLK